MADAVALYIDSKGQLGTICSSERFKKDIQDTDDSSRHLLELRPVTYHYNQATDDGRNPLEYGLIVEEVDKIYPDLVAYGADGKVETMQYHKLTPMLINEVKRLNTLLQSDKDKNVAQSENIKAQEFKIALQEQEIGKLKLQISAMQAKSEQIEKLSERIYRIEANQLQASTE